MSDTWRNSEIASESDGSGLIKSAGSSRTRERLEAIIPIQSALSSAKMSGAFLTEKEVLLCILPQPQPDDIVARIKANHPSLEIRWIQRQFGSSHVDLPEDAFKDVTILYTGATFPATHEEAPKLKYVHLFSAGTDRVIKHPLFTETKIIFTNSSGVHGPQISEWIIMTALVHNHSYLRNYESQKVKRWDRLGAWGINDLVKQRLGVLGYGAIGRQSNSQILTDAN
jgi:phosphoglycerate dehydrogenase-like enzyme